jgi:hypothetical protein
MVVDHGRRHLNLTVVFRDAYSANEHPAFAVEQQSREQSAGDDDEAFHS